MAVTAKLYGKFIENLAKKQIDLVNDTIKVMLCTSSYTPDQDTHEHKADVTNEITGTGYTAGGVALANKTVTYTGATNVLKFDADDAQWTSSTLTFRTAVIYDATTNDLIGYVDYGSDKSSEAGTVTIPWDTAGIFTLTVS